MSVPHLALAMEGRVMTPERFKEIEMMAEESPTYDIGMLLELVPAYQEAEKRIKELEAENMMLCRLLLSSKEWMSVCLHSDKMVATAARFNHGRKGLITAIDKAIG